MVCKGWFMIGGQFVIKQNDKLAQTHDPFDKLGLMRDVALPDDTTTEAPPEIAYLEIDGVVPMTRDLDAARSPRYNTAFLTSRPISL